MKRFIQSFLPVAIMTMGLILAGCDKYAPQEPVTNEETELDFGALAKEAESLNAPSVERLDHPDVVVHPGESIQAAVNGASPGALILIEPGTYKEAVTVAKPGIKLVGLRGRHGRGVEIKNPGSAENGITVTDDGDGFVLVNVTVRDFEENGVFLVGVDGFLIFRVTAENNGEYGIFPVLSSHGVIDHCTATT